MNKKISFSRITFGVLFGLLIIIPFQKANATYCSLKTPQYCPPQGNGGTNNFNPKFNNNFDPSIKNNIRLNVAAQTKVNASAQAKALGIGYGGQGGLGGSGGNGYGGEGGQGNGFGGQTDITMSNIGNSVSNVPRQAPMAYAPPPMVSANAFSCSMMATGAVSSTLGGISLGIPLTEDNCPIFVMSQFLYANHQPVEGCEILNNIPEIKEVRQKTGFTCIPTVSRSAPVAAPMNVPPNAFWDKADKKTDAILDALHKKHSRK